MTFNKCSINGVVYGNQDEVNYGVSDDMIKVRPILYIVDSIMMWVTVHNN